MLSRKQAENHLAEMLSVVCLCCVFMKLCEDICIQYRDISIFTKFAMAIVRHLGFVGGRRRTTHDSTVMVAIQR